MGVLDLDIATVEWMRGASDEAVVVGVEDVVESSIRVQAPLTSWFGQHRGMRGCLMS